MLSLFHRFLRDERGSTSLEYGLVAALVAVALVGALSTLAGGLQQTLAQMHEQGGNSTP
jgi:pilus assembly protein Flp/PilA